MANCDCKQLLEDARNDPNITHLRLHCSIHFDYETECLMNGLRGTSVTSLDLGYNFLRFKVAKILVNGLQNTQVEILEMRQCELGDKGIKYLAEGLKNTKIRKLGLSINNIGPQGCKDLADGLIGSKVESLDLSINYIKSQGVEHLAKVLKDTHLQNLNLKYNFNGNRAAEFLAHGLRGSQLINIDLSLNEIGSEGAKSLANVLKDTQVEKLNLNYNNIGPEGATHLLASIRDTGVTELSLSLQDSFAYEEKFTTELRAVLRKNKQNVAEMRENFKLLVSKDAEEGPLAFQVHVAAEGDQCIDTEKYLGFIRSVHDLPYVVPHMFNDPDVGFERQEIVQFLENISIRFSEFLSKVLVETDHSKYVELLKKCEDLRMDYVLKDLLLNRAACTIEGCDLDVLYPYVYVLLDRYKQPLLLNDQKQEIVEFFMNHPEFQCAQEAIELLQNINKNKRRKMM